MTTNRKAKAKVMNADGGFIECELDEEERGLCRQWITSGEQLLEIMQQLCDDKFTLKVGYEPRNDCYAAYISGHWVQNKPDAKWTLSGRGSTASNAIRQALYKHYEILKGDWSEHKTGVSRERNWD